MANVMTEDERTALNALVRGEKTMVGAARRLGIDTSTLDHARGVYGRLRRDSVGRIRESIRHLLRTDPGCFAWKTEEIDAAFRLLGDAA
jgi:hypothetical protein